MRNIADGVGAGETIADGITRFPEIFPGAVIDLMRAGELTGDLEGLTQVKSQFHHNRCSAAEPLRRFGVAVEWGGFEHRAEFGVGVGECFLVASVPHLRFQLR